MMGVTRLGSMPGTRAVSSALSAVACAAALAACGGEDTEETIPADQGQVLLDRLDQVEQRVEDGDCEAASDAALEFARGVTELPAEVDDELRQRLVEASANLEGLTQDPSQCEPSGATGETGPLPVEPTTTPETTATTTTETTTEEPPDEDDGQGSGQGNGQPQQPPEQSGDEDRDGGSGGVGSD